MSRVIPLFGLHVCGDGACMHDIDPPPRPPLTRKERREARRYEAKQARRQARRNAR